MKVLNARSFALKARIHETFDRAWKGILVFDVEAGQATIRDSIPDVQMSLADAAIGLKAYKEVDERMEQLWRNLDAAIFLPRMDQTRQMPPSIRIDGDTLQLDGQATPGVGSLLTDLERALAMIAKKLPHDLLGPLSRWMMPDLIQRLIEQWLTPAVPSNLTRMDVFHTMIEDTESFCQSLDALGFAQIDELKRWAKNAPMTWLGKCRENALDNIRTSLAKGIGESRPVEKIEKQMVSVAEGNELATTGAGASADTNDWGAEWGAEWDDNDEEMDVDNSVNKAAAPNEDTAPGAEEDDGADAWGWGDEDDTVPNDAKPEERNGASKVTEEDDPAAAWGWGDEDEAAQQPKTSPAKSRKRPVPTAPEETRELVLKETYHISSMPDPVLQLISRILEDGATLTRGEEQYSHVANTAPGLFSLPTFALALFRAISPHYYPVDEGGSM